MIVYFPESDAAGAIGYVLQSGDVVTVKVTTQAGTFAQATYTVPYGLE